VDSVVHNLRKRWDEFRSAEPGMRFQRFHDEQGRRRSPPWIRALYIAMAAVSFVVGVVLAFIPGPAVVFFALTAALLAAQSEWIARRLDAAELWLRRRLHR
jgi:fatty acid desaturase